MPLTKDFRLTIMERARKDDKFCEQMLTEAITELLSGDFDAGKAMLRDYINATISFEVLSKYMAKDSKSLMRMLSPSGNPTTKSLLMMLQIIQKVNKLHFKITINYLGKAISRY